MVKLAQTYRATYEERKKVRFVGTTIGKTVKIMKKRLRRKILERKRKGGQGSQRRKRKKRRNSKKKK